MGPSTILLRVLQNRPGREWDVFGTRENHPLLLGLRPLSRPTARPRCSAEQTSCSNEGSPSVVSRADESFPTSPEEGNTGNKNRERERERKSVIFAVFAPKNNKEGAGKINMAE